MATTTAELCQGLPEVFLSYFDHVRKLEYDERPDYAGMRAMFAGAIAQLGEANDGVFDWHETSSSGSGGGGGGGSGVRKGRY